MSRTLRRTGVAMLTGVLLLTGCSTPGSSTPDDGGSADGGAGGSASSPTASSPTASTPSAAPTPSVAVPTGATTAYEGARFVALGDSYTAAPLVPPHDDSSGGCVRSLANYPQLVADALGAVLVDRSCAGAVTANLTAVQQTYAGPVRPQLGSVGPRTRLVTLSLGGNDFGLFGSLLGGCRAEANAPPCQDLTERAVVDDRIDTIEERLVTAVRDIQERAPRARVVVVGYPAVVGAARCDDLAPVEGRLPAARRLNRGLVAAQEAAAERTGATYVDVFSASRGHELCSDDPWINGLQTDPSRALAMHPLAAEQEAVAQLVVDALG